MPSQDMLAYCCIAVSSKPSVIDKGAWELTKIEDRAVRYGRSLYKV